MKSEDKYIRVNGGYRETMPQVNEWYKICQDIQKPFIVVRGSKKYAHISWDYISFHSDKDVYLEIDPERVKTMLIELFKAYAVPSSTYSLNSHVAEFEKIPVEVAEYFASDLYDCINSIVK